MTIFIYTAQWPNGHIVESVSDSKARAEVEFRQLMLPQIIEPFRLDFITSIKNLDTKHGFATMEWQGVNFSYAEQTHVTTSVPQ